MKERLSKTTWRAVSGVAASMVMIFSFQNCGKAGFDANLESSLDSVITYAAVVAMYGSTQAAKISSIPFAIDARFDQISYNSCAESTLKGNSQFFSIKAGSYNSSIGGVKLRQTFFDYVDSNFYPLEADSTISESQYKEYFADSPANNQAVPALSVRVKSSLLDVYSTNTTLTLGTDVVGMLGYLTGSGIMDAFVRPGGNATYFPFSEDFKTMEATLNFNDSEGTARKYRDLLMTKAALTLTYLKDQSLVNEIRAPSATTPLATAYGRGYTFVFSQPIGSTTQNMPSNIVYSLREYDLENPSDVKNWSCDRRYMIYRSQDAAACPSHTITELQNESIRAELEIVRRQFPADQWEFNVSRRCAIPKGSVSCYKEETYNGAAVGAQYNLAAECFQPYGVYSGTTPLPRCAQFISICTRPN